MGVIKKSKDFQSILPGSTEENSSSGQASCAKAQTKKEETGEQTARQPCHLALGERPHQSEQPYSDRTVCIDDIERCARSHLDLVEAHSDDQGSQKRPEGPHSVIEDATHRI